MRHCVSKGENYAGGSAGANRVVDRFRRDICRAEMMREFRSVKIDILTIQILDVARNSAVNLNANGAVECVVHRVADKRVSESISTAVVLGNDASA